jgi:hypothetical protein
MGERAAKRRGKHSAASRNQSRGSRVEGREPEAESQRAEKSSRNCAILTYCSARNTRKTGKDGSSFVTRKFNIIHFGEDVPPRISRISRMGKPSLIIRAILQSVVAFLWLRLAALRLPAG